MPCDMKQSFSYDDADRALLMNHVQKHFGTISGIGQTQLSENRTLELLAVTPPSRRHIGKLFSTANDPELKEETLLVTFGAGAMPMNVPKDSELPPRAEYLIRLPADWDIQSGDESSAWPVRLLMNISALPEAEQSYNAWGHTFSFAEGAPFADNTSLCAAMLTGMNDREGQCRLTSGENVIFYEVIPLYAEELEFTAEHGAVALFDEFIRYHIPRVVTIQRPNAAILAAHRHTLIQTTQNMTEQEILRLQEHSSSPEDTMVLEEILRSKSGLRNRALSMMKTLTHSIRKR